VKNHCAKLQAGWKLIFDVINRALDVEDSSLAEAAFEVST